MGFLYRCRPQQPLRFLGEFLLERSRQVEAAGSEGNENGNGNGNGAVG